jgi:uncharacterized protein
MRLPGQPVSDIKRAADVFGDDVEVGLFGSRADDQRRGGDIDLLICRPRQRVEQTLREKIQFLAQLERRLGERTVNVVIEQPGDSRRIVRIAHQTGVRL